MSAKNRPIYQLILPALLSLLLLCCLYTGCNSPAPGTSGNKKTPQQDNLRAGRLKGMIFIPAGEFLMGSDQENACEDEKPAHTIYLDAFYIDKYEVTNAQYQEFLQDTGHPPPSVDAEWAKPYNWNGLSYPDGMGKCPVVLVSWNDAMAYARWAGKRLPTEAEWEKAARGGLISQKYPFGNKIELHQANFYKGYFRTRKLMPVGSYKSNSFGIFDMAGNVWEWCQDWYSPSYYIESPSKNPMGPAAGLYRVFRGGSWQNEKRFLRCSQRGKNIPSYKSHTVGFRCALSAEP